MPMLEVITKSSAAIFARAFDRIAPRGRCEVGDIRLIQVSEFLTAAAAHFDQLSNGAIPRHGAIITKALQFRLWSTSTWRSGKVRFRVEDGLHLDRIEHSCASRAVGAAGMSKAWDSVEPVNIGFQSTRSTAVRVQRAPTEIVLIVESSVDSKDSPDSDLLLMR
jgi:hypothetical protein